MSAALLWLAVGAGPVGAAGLPLRPLAVDALELPVLALAFVASDELLALAPTAVARYRLEGLRLRPSARHAVEAGGPGVRFPGGLLLAETGSRSVWALASGWRHALLLDLEAGLEVRSEALALPWPGARRGVRFRSGTSLLEAELPGLGPAPFLALAPGAALDSAARLWRGGDPLAAAVGTPLARVPGGLLAGSTAPPGEPDALLFLADGAPAPRLLRGDLPGALRALAARARRGGGLLCVLALETSAGTRLFSLELAATP